MTPLVQARHNLEALEAELAVSQKALYEAEGDLAAAHRRKALPSELQDLEHLVRRAAERYRVNREALPTAKRGLERVFESVWAHREQIAYQESVIAARRKDLEQAQRVLEITTSNAQARIAEAEAKIAHLTGGAPVPDPPKASPAQLQYQASAEASRRDIEAALRPPTRTALERLDYLVEQLEGLAESER